MPNGPRETPYRKYNISRHKFLALYHYALEYQEWKDELKYKYNTVKAVTVSDMPFAPQNGESNPTRDTAIACAELQQKIEAIEESAKLADEQLAPYILKAVTEEHITYNYLRMHMNIPCSANTFYDRRRRFYWILSSKVNL